MDISEHEAYNTASSAERLVEPGEDPALRITVAGNPASPANLLALLAQDPDVQVREQVASNPNTPWPVLEQLAWEFPHAFLYHPVGSLQVMAHSEQINTDETFWGALLREATLPSLWWDWLLSHPTLSQQEAIRLHIQSTGETSHFCGVLQREEEQEVLKLVLLLTAAYEQKTSLPIPPDQPGNSAVQMLEERLSWLADSNKGEIRLEVANNPLTPEALLGVMARDEESDVRSGVAENERTPGALLQILAHDEDGNARCGVAAHKHAPAEVLYLLGQDDDDRVRYLVAKHPKTPVEALVNMALDGDAYVQMAVAGNPHTPVKTLLELALNEYVETRRAVAENPQATVELLQLLSQDTHAKVRQAIAGNPHTPKALLFTLGQDQDEQVRQTVAKNPRTPVEVLLGLGQDKSALVRTATAGNEQIPVQALQILAQDSQIEVRKAVAWNKQTPTKTRQALTQDKQAEVQKLAHFVQNLLADGPFHEQPWWQELGARLIASHSWTEGKVSPGHQLLMISWLEVPNHIRQTILALLSIDWDMTKLQKAFSVSGWTRLMAPYVPPTVLEKLSISPHWEERYLVALHEQTPSETRQLLCQDGNRYVRAIARAKMALIRENEFSGERLT